jgi:hypothetical protein
VDVLHLKPTGLFRVASFLCVMFPYRGAGAVCKVPLISEWAMKEAHASRWVPGHELFVSVLALVLALAAKVA